MIAGAGANQIGNKGAVFLASFIESASSLKMLDLHNNNIGDEGLWSILQAADKAAGGTLHRSLEVLDMSRNQIRLSTTFYLPPTLQSLILKNNEIPESSAQNLTAAVAACPKLTTIDLRGTWHNMLVTTKDDIVNWLQSPQTKSQPLLPSTGSCSNGGNGGNGGKRWSGGRRDDTGRDARAGGKSRNDEENMDTGGGGSEDDAEPGGGGGVCSGPDADTIKWLSARICDYDHSKDEWIFQLDECDRNESCAGCDQCRFTIKSDDIVAW